MMIQQENQRLNTYVRRQKGSAPLSYAFAFVPNPYWERNTNDDGKACEQRVTAAVSEFGIHFLSEEREYESKDGLEHG